VTDEEKMEKTRERGGEKRSGDAPQGLSVTSENRCTRSLLRRTRARRERARAPAGRRGRKTGGEVRSGGNAIIEAGRREGRMRIRAPEKGTVRRRGKTRGNRSGQDAISIGCW